MPTHIAVIRPTAATSTATACFKIASGASDYDYNWTEVLMDKAGNLMDGISLHYYTTPGWVGSKGSATKFTDDDYYWTLGKCLEVGDVTRKHMDIMDKFDPNKRVALLVDEWGTCGGTRPEPCPVTSISKTQCVTQWWQLCH